MVFLVIPAEAGSLFHRRVVASSQQSPLICLIIFIFVGPLAAVDVLAERLFNHLPLLLEHPLLHKVAIIIQLSIRNIWLIALLICKHVIIGALAGHPLLMVSFPERQHLLGPKGIVVLLHLHLGVQ